MKSVAELNDALRMAWRAIPPPSMDTLDFLGADAAEELSLVLPIEVDLENDNMSAVELSMDLPPALQATYLGAFLLSVLDSYAIQKIIDFPVEIGRRADVITMMTNPRFWSEVVKPNLPVECWIIIAELVTFMVSERDIFALTEEQCETLDRLSRAMNWAIDQSL